MLNRDNMLFVKEFISNPVTVSSLFPSSRELARKMVDVCHIKQPNVVVELGCGTGSVTEYILKKFNGETKIIVIDINERFIETIKDKFPSVVSVNDSAENLEQHLEKLKIKSVDAVISSLPWAVFNHKITNKLLNIIVRRLTKKGEFVTFSYLHTFYLKKAKFFRKKLFSRFRRVTISKPIWSNLPPAVVYHCIK